jgi:MinD superfamily P-loop ATPase
MNIAIASGKGGTGKTTLSTNLASYIAEQEPCVLTDLDVEEPNSGLFINADLVHEHTVYKMIPAWDPSACTLCGKCQEVCNFNAVLKMGSQIMVFPQLCHSCYACSELCPTASLPMKEKLIGELKMYQSGHLHFVESRLMIGEEQAVPMIKQTLDHVHEQFAENVIKIFDCPPGTSCPVIESVRDADIVILVTEPTPFGLHDLKLAVETMRKLKKPYVVVINREGIGDSGVRQYCESEDIEVVAAIENSRLIAQTYAKGELLYHTIDSVRTAVETLYQMIRQFRNMNKEHRQ